jgi:hypothetical protein
MQLKRQDHWQGAQQEPSEGEDTSAKPLLWVIRCDIRPFLISQENNGEHFVL